MENLIQEDLIPNDLKQQDVSIQFAYALKAYSDSIVQEKEDAAAYYNSKRKRKLWKKEMDRLMADFNKSVDEEDAPVLPKAETIPAFSITPTPNTSNENHEGKSGSESVNLTEPNSPSVEGLSVADLFLGLIDEIDRVTTSEEICEYKGFETQAERKRARSALKYLRKSEKVYGIPFYIPPSNPGKAYRKAYMNSLPRFYQNNDTSKPLLSKYQHQLTESIDRLGWITKEEVEKRGGSIMNED